MKAMILAAGFGKRLGDITKNKPKPLVQVQGKCLIDHHIEKLLFAKIKQITINTHYLAEQIANHVTSKYSDSADISIVYEKEILGTGGGILNATKNFGSEDFVVINSDIYSDYDYSKFKNKSSTKVFVVPNDNNSGDFTVKDGTVMLGEKKDFTWTGFSVINRDIIMSCQKEKFHYWEDCLKIHAASNMLEAEILNINWYDVGSIDVLNYLNKES